VRGLVAREVGEEVRDDRQFDGVAPAQGGVEQVDPVGVLDADSNTGDGKENNDPAAAIGGVPFPANDPGPFEAVDDAGDGAAG
jgi:hypothetical protein